MKSKHAEACQRSCNYGRTCPPLDLDFAPRVPCASSGNPLVRRGLRAGTILALLLGFVPFNFFNSLNFLSFAQEFDAWHHRVVLFQGCKILNIIDASGDTDLDYDSLFTNKKQYFNMIKRFDTKDVSSIKEGYYQHGSIIIDKKASLDKLCYYSAVVDAYISFLIKHKITEYKSYLAIALLFTIYSNGTTLFVLTINSLMKNQYLGKSNVNLFDTVSLLNNNKNIKIDHWVYLISTQTSWEISYHRSQKNVGTKPNPKIAASTSPRHTHSNIHLPHSSPSDQEICNSV